MSLADAVKVYALAFAVYKTVELGPYDAAIWFGRFVRAFALAAHGYQ